ncbi:MAG: DUF3820 family protein [Planctomycetota bacterium]
MQQYLFGNDQPITTQSVSRLKFTPRDYQAEAIGNFYNLVDGGSPGAILRCFTGGGKTFMGAMAAERWIGRSNDHYVFVLGHERQLVEQFRAELGEFLQIPIGLEMGTDGSVAFGRYDTPRITVASRATLAEQDGKSRLYKFDHKKHWLVIIDECHRYAYSLPSCKHIIDWFENNPESKRLGLSATPERGDGISLGRLFPDVALDYKMFGVHKNAIEDGWCVPFDQRFVSVEGVDFQNIGDVNGDLDVDELDEALRQREALLSMVKPLIDLVGDRRTIIFSPKKKTARAVAHTINEFKPHSARSIDGDANTDLKKKRFSQHQSGHFQFLSVCGLCREGYNDPGIMAVAVFRPTKSRSLAEQMKGRGSRPLKGIVDGFETAEERRKAIAASDKPNCMIIDLVGVTGLPPVASTAHLLASGKPDEVIQRANQNAMKNNGPTDMVEELAKAERQIAEENEAANLRYQAQLQAEKEEADRLAKIKGEVRYSASRVGDGGGVAKRELKGVKQEITEIPFGKFKGTQISELPDYYLNWAIDKCKGGGLQKSIRKEINKRQGMNAPATEKQIKVLSRFGYAADGLTQAQAGDIITNQINKREMSRA